MRGYIDLAANVGSNANLLFRAARESESENDVPPFHGVKERNPLGRPGTAAFPNGIGDLPGLSRQAVGLDYSIPAQCG